MYCKNCGKEIGDSRFCPYCGAENPTELITAHPYEKKEEKTFGWGILGYFFPIVGLILFLVWREDRPKAAESAGVGALFSVITGGVGSVIAVIVIFVVFGAAFGIAASASAAAIGALHFALL